MATYPSSFRVSSLYSSDEIQNALGVGNAGGVRISLSDDRTVRRMVIMTSLPSARQARENPYHDRIEGTTLVYTGAGKEGDQTLAGVNQRIPQQSIHEFPIYAFQLIGSRRDQQIGPKRWRFLGLLRYVRHFPEVQVDVRMQQRRAWVFEFRIHVEPAEVPVANEQAIMAELFSSARSQEPDEPADREIGTPAPLIGAATEVDPILIESVRGQLLGISPERFEHVVKDALEHSGFHRVTVTRYSQDGGIDVNAFAGLTMWAIRDLLVQVQAKRWLHTVGRKEVAEIRGSLQPHSRGAIVTTSQFSRAAIIEADEPGKSPITLVDGFSFASIVNGLKLTI